MQVKLLKLLTCNSRLWKQLNFKKFCKWLIFKWFGNLNFHEWLKTKFATESSRIYSKVCVRRALYLKYCNKIRLTVSQYSTRIIKIKCVLSCASYIFFAVHYNYIYDCYFFFFFFLALCTTWWIGKTCGRCSYTENGSDRCEIRPRRGSRCFGGTTI